MEVYIAILAAIITGPLSVAVSKWWDRRKDKKLLKDTEAEGRREDFKAVNHAQERLIKGLYREMDRREKVVATEMKRAEQDCLRRIAQVKEDLLEKIVELESQLPVPGVDPI